MEGASWVAKKATTEAEVHTTKLAQLLLDFEKKT